MKKSIVRSLSVTAVTGALVLGGGAAAAASTDGDSRTADRSQSSSGFSLGAPLSFGESSFDTSSGSVARESTETHRLLSEVLGTGSDNRSVEESRSSSSESADANDQTLRLGGFSIEPALTVVNESVEAAERESSIRGGSGSASSSDSSSSERSSGASGIDAGIPISFDGLDVSSSSESAERQSEESTRTEASERSGDVDRDTREQSSSESSSTESTREGADRSETSGSIGGLDVDPNLSSTNEQESASETEQRERSTSDRDGDLVGGLVDGLLGTR